MNIISPPNCTVAVSKIYSIVAICVSFWIVPGLLAYSQPASEISGLSAVAVDRIYLAAGVTDKDEEATIGDPDEQAQTGDPGEQATVGNPGERATISDPGEQATVGDPGEKAGIGDPDEEATIGDPEEKSRF
jgi:hypothetical protein